MLHDVFEMVLGELGDDSFKVSLEHQSVFVQRVCDVVGDGRRAKPFLDVAIVAAKSFESVGCYVVNLGWVSSDNGVLKEECVEHGHEIALLLLGTHGWIREEECYELS